MDFSIFRQRYVRKKRYVHQFKMVKNRAWLLEGEGCQLVLEGLQRCLAYCSLRELVP